MNTALRAWISVLLLIAFHGCVVVEPGDGSQQSPDAPVAFAGYTAVRAQRVELQARTAQGTFETFAVTYAGRDAQVLEDGTRLYAWQHAAVVPHWTGSDCERSAEVRALGMVGRAGTPLLTFDEEGASCVNDAVQRGVPVGLALTACAKSLQSVITLHAGSGTVLGDVVVTTQAQANALSCATEIDGDLTVRPAQQVVSMPNLQHVTGDVFIEVEDGAVGGGGIVEAEQADLPALSSIGGDLRFSHVDAGSYVGVNLGLPALTSVQGDLFLELSSFNGYNIGLSALQTVGGDGTIVADGDFYAPLLLTSLAAVLGDLSVSTSSAGSSSAVLNSLQSVGGSVSLSGLRNFTSPILDGLQSVGGDLTILDSYWIGTRLSALTSVGGTLHVGGFSLGSLPPGPRMGGASLAMGALTLIDSHFSEVPFPAATTVAVSGAITIEDNALLCQASVDAFVTAQQDAGWAGPLATSNNTGSCAP